MILQVMECLKQNEELRGILDNLRDEQARGLPDSSKNGAHEMPSLASTEEMTSMKVSYTVRMTYFVPLCCQFMSLTCLIKFKSYWSNVVCF